MTRNLESWRIFFQKNISDIGDAKPLPFRLKNSDLSSLFRLHPSFRDLVDVEFQFICAESVEIMFCATDTPYGFMDSKSTFKKDGRFNQK